MSDSFYAASIVERKQEFCWHKVVSLAAALIFARH